MVRARADPNASYGARCFLTWSAPMSLLSWATRRLNAPFGARCLLMPMLQRSRALTASIGHNAPFGDRCFLTVAVVGIILVSINES